MLTLSLYYMLSDANDMCQTYLAIFVILFIDEYDIAILTDYDCHLLTILKCIDTCLIDGDGAGNFHRPVWFHPVHQVSVPSHPRGELCMCPWKARD